MSKFYKIEVNRDEMSSADAGTSIKKLADLLQGNEYAEEIIELFEIDPLSNEFIPIPGLNKLTKSIITKDQEFVKMDFDIHLSKISLAGYTEGGEAILQLELNEEQKAKADGNNSLKVETIYNSRADYFEGSYQLDKFSKFCFQHDHVGLLKNTIKELNEHYKKSTSHMRSFRLLRDDENKYYLRAITSVDRYKDYNIRFSVFVVAMVLGQLAQKKNWTFVVDRFEYDESNIRVYFEKVGLQNIQGVGAMRFMVELSNDEIKREAMRLSTVVSIVGKSKGEDFAIYLKPQQTKYVLFSIRHNFDPQTLFNHIAGLANKINNAQEELYKDMEAISKVKNPDELRFRLQQRLAHAHQVIDKEEKGKIITALNTKISTISELLLMMNKVDMIVTDLETKEYLRYLYYEIFPLK